MSMAWIKAMWLQWLYINPFAVPMTSRDVQSEGLASARNMSLNVLLVMCCSRIVVLFTHCCIVHALLYCSRIVVLFTHAQEKPVSNKGTFLIDSTSQQDPFEKEVPQQCKSFGNKRVKGSTDISEHVLSNMC